MSVATGPFVLPFGYIPPAVASASTFQLSAAANWFALAFTPETTRTLSAVRAFISAVAGTLASTDITCSLYDSTAATGGPGSSIATGKLPTATINASGWYDFTGFSTVLTAGTMYWVVFKNANGVPGTNNCTFRYCLSAISDFALGHAQGFRCSWVAGTTTNSGTTWATSTGATGVRISYADGSYAGAPLSNVIASSADRVYLTRESGVKLTSPGGAVLNVVGLALTVGAVTGSPAGFVRIGLYTGSSPSLFSYTNSPPIAFSLGGVAWTALTFSSPQAIQPSTICRITLADAAGNTDSISNNYGLRELVADTDANSLAIRPFNGTLQKTYFDGSSWTDTPGSMFGVVFLLDPTNPFTAVGGGGPVGQLVGAFARGGYF